MINFFLKLKSKKILINRVYLQRKYRLIQNLFNFKKVTILVNSKFYFSFFNDMFLVYITLLSILFLNLFITYYVFIAFTSFILIYIFIIDFNTLNYWEKLDCTSQIGDIFNG